MLFSWLIPFCADIMNKFRVGPDGRTAYERITEHKCRSMIIGFGESVDYILETDKCARHKADSRVHQGIFLAYVGGVPSVLSGLGMGYISVGLLNAVLKKMLMTPSAPNTSTHFTMTT